MKTIDEAKTYLFENGMFEKAAFIEGAECPCCGQFVKLYPRPIHTSMAYDLIKFYQYYKKNNIPFTQSVYIPDILEDKRSADFVKLFFWGMLQKDIGLREDGSKRNGYYSLTETGVAFVQKRLRVPKYKYMYNGKVYLTYDQSGETIDIREALGNKFNYYDLMK